MKIGVLALQAAFQEHRKALDLCGVENSEVYLPEDLEKIDALIISGQQSKALEKLILDYQLFEPIIDWARQGMPVFGICAGLTLMAKNIHGTPVLSFGLMDIDVVENGFGFAEERFETNLQIPALGTEPVPGVFIQAPCINSVKPNVGIMAKYAAKIVMVRQGSFLVTSFQPELTSDLRVHRYFIKIVQEGQE